MNKLINFSLALIAAYAFSGCVKQKEPSLEEYLDNYSNTYASKNGLPLEMFDTNGDKKVDGIADKENYFAVDTNVIKMSLYGSYNGRMFQKWTIPMDSQMVDLASRIARLEKELTFKMDSVYYARNIRQ